MSDEDLLEDESEKLDRNKFKYLKDEYFIVKIAGKGNIKDGKDLENLINNLDSSIRLIIETINSYKGKKQVLIIWDGDDYQENSPFTSIIKELSIKEKQYDFAALKPTANQKTKWKRKHFNSWGIDKLKIYHMDKKETHENFKDLLEVDLDDLEPYILNNSLCDMYVSYGASLFKGTSGYQQLYGDGKSKNPIQKFTNYKNEDSNFYPFTTNYFVEEIQNNIDGLEIFVKDELDEYRKESGFDRLGGKKSKKNKKTKRTRKLKKTKSRKVRKSKKIRR